MIHSHACSRCSSKIIIIIKKKEIRIETVSKPRVRKQLRPEMEFTSVPERFFDGAAETMLRYSDIVRSAITQFHVVWKTWLANCTCWGAQNRVKVEKPISSETGWKVEQFLIVQIKNKLIVITHTAFSVVRGQWIVQFYVSRSKRNNFFMVQVTLWTKQDFWSKDFPGDLVGTKVTKDFSAFNFRTQ